MCAGQVCHCVAFIEGNYYVRTSGTVVDAKDAAQYFVAKDAWKRSERKVARRRG